MGHQEEDHQAAQTDGTTGHQAGHQEDPMVHPRTTAPPHPPTEGTAANPEHE